MYLLKYLVPSSSVHNRDVAKPRSACLAEKVNPRWLQFNLFLLPPRVIPDLLCWESLLILWRQDNSPSAYPPFHTSTTMSFPPPPSAPGGGGDPPRHSGRQGKLYLATKAARAAATRRKEDRANVLLSRPNIAPPSTPSNRATRYQNRSEEKSLSEAPLAAIIPGKNWLPLLRHRSSHRLRW